MKKIILSLLVAGSLVSCSDNKFEEINTPVKNPAEVPGYALFTNGAREMFDMMVNTSVNQNPFRLYSQYWAQTTYPEESQYQMVPRQIPDSYWANGYVNVLNNLTQAKKVTEPLLEDVSVNQEEIKNQLAVIDICIAYTYLSLVDAFGNIPYTDALNIDILTPKYDDAASVYDAMIEVLNGSIANITDGTAAFSAVQDPIYRGDATAWKTFAYTLKFKVGVMLLDADPAKAATLISESKDHIFTSNADNASIEYSSTSPSTNPVWEALVQSGRKDYIIANTVANKLNDLNDPRLFVFAQDPIAFPFRTEEDGAGETVKKDSVFSADDVVGKVLVYEAVDGSDSVVYKKAPFTVTVEEEKKGVSLIEGGVYGTANSYSSFSHIGKAFYEPDLPGIILSYSEIEFFKAELAERGVAGYSAADAEMYYNNGITASLAEWGITDATVVADYLAHPQVAYATAEGDWKQKIGSQLWLALYNRGFEGWTSWRRLDFEGFVAPPGLSLSDIPTRFIYPIQEGTLNGANKSSAASAIGGDEKTTKLFWDKN
ncbi:SusD/RagB family nutrient-binding outer membrane lipoprotein [Flammeovirga sp. OC4]|uniref:SusD/RagB family nutrient-binding outer membrane lipoprotein n=1 Tax=Flammeovirga sp. OC4 TaxID=1382345 RepID=UPI0005C63DEC|nr:SusD/RagB family nutrient-binding outer membrane lipoprotein [Flammeovirga sp. OC4]